MSQLCPALTGRLRSLRPAGSCDRPPPPVCAQCGAPRHTGPCDNPSPDPVTDPPPSGPKRYFGVYDVDPERYGRDMSRLGQEVLQHLTSLDDVQLRISIEIEAIRNDGFPDDKTRVVRENARTLKFRQSSFE